MTDFMLRNRSAFRQKIDEPGSGVRPNPKISTF